MTLTEEDKRAADRLLDETATLNKDVESLTHTPQNKRPWFPVHYEETQRQTERDFAAEFREFTEMLGADFGIEIQEPPQGEFSVDIPEIQFVDRERYNGIRRRNF